MIVRVYNDNVHPYSEKYKGRQITIPSKGYIEMDLNEAHHFLGTNPGIANRDASGLQSPETYKKLRIERPQETKTKAQAQAKSFDCHACNKRFESKSAYESHVEEMHLGVLKDPEVAEKIVKRTGRPKKGVTSDASTDRDGGAT